MKCSQADERWVREQLARLPYSQRERAKEGYSAAYQRAYDDEPMVHRKENRARFEANTRLREFINKVLALR